MKKYCKVIALCILIVFLSSCSSDNSKKDHKLNVVTTFYPLYDLASKLLKDDANVTMLINGNISLHDYEPTSDDIKSIIKADVFIYSSNDLEIWVNDILKNNDLSKTIVIEASKDLAFLDSIEDHDEDDDHDDHDEELDPHVWLDPILYIEMLNNISDNLINKYPSYKDNLSSNTNDYLNKLEALNDKYLNAFSDVNNKTFITTHAAFGYLADRYQLNQVAILGINSEEEASLSRLKEVVELVKENNAKIIYYEENSKNDYALTIANEAKIDIASLNTLEIVDTNNNKLDYIAMMELNLKALQLSIK